MKRTITLLLAAIMTLSLTACGEPANSSAASTQKPTASNEATSAPDKAKEDGQSGNPDTVDFSGQKEVGNGKFYVTTSAGSSEDVDAPVIYIDPDVLDPSIGIEAWDFDGGKLTYLYIDGELADKEQLADNQTWLDLTEAGKKAGKHTVSAVQYDTDDPSGQIVTYKSAVYEAKDE